MGVRVLEVPGIMVVFPGTVYFKSKGILGVLACWCAGGGCIGVERRLSSVCDSSLLSQDVPGIAAGLLNAGGAWGVMWLLFNRAWSFAATKIQKKPWDRIKILQNFVDIFANHENINFLIISILLKDNMLKFLLRFIIINRYFEDFWLNSHLVPFLRRWQCVSCVFSRHWPRWQLRQWWVSYL